jgi:hypothetical protein
MLEIQCDRCHSELKQPGALIFSPPTGQAWLVEKYHVCADCWEDVAALLKTDKRSEPTQRASKP